MNRLFELLVLLLTSEGGSFLIEEPESVESQVLHLPTIKIKIITIHSIKYFYNKRIILLPQTVLLF